MFKYKMVMSYHNLEHALYNYGNDLDELKAWADEVDEKYSTPDHVQYYEEYDEEGNSLYINYLYNGFGRA